MDRATLDAAWKEALKSRKRGTLTNAIPHRPGQAGTSYTIPLGPRRIGVYILGDETWVPRTSSPSAELHRKEIAALNRLLTPWWEQRPLNDDQRSALEFMFAGVVNGPHWAGYIRDVIVREVEVFSETVTDRILASFDSLSTEVRQRADKALETYEILSLDDRYSAQRDAYDKAEAWAMNVSSVYWSCLALVAVGLFHQFEQHAGFLYGEVGANVVPESESISRVFSDWLAALGVGTEKLRTWAKIQELQLLANTVKHGEGRAARQLREQRPALFEIPGAPGSHVRGWPVQKPLAGEDIFVSADEFKRYARAIRRFWCSLAVRFERVPWRG